MTLKKTVIIQARWGSSRLPGKVLLDIAGQPMLAHVVERSRRAALVDQVVVATTSDPADDAVEALCCQRGYPCCRGSLHDVLDRYYQAARTFGADVVIRLTADCPLIDPAVIDEVVAAFLGSPRDDTSLPYDFTANRLPPPWHRTYPIGLDVEVCTFAALERAWREAVQAHQREHVMPYLYEGFRPGEITQNGFRVLVIDHDPDYGSLRWTVDTPADLELLRQVFARFPGRDDFSWTEVLELFRHEPGLAEINANVRHKRYDDVDGRHA